MSTSQLPLSEDLLPPAAAAAKKDQGDCMSCLVGDSDDDEEEAEESELQPEDEDELQAEFFACLHRDL